MATSMREASGKMKSIEEEMSRFEEEIMSLSQDPSPIGGAAADQEKQHSMAPKRPGFQPRQTQYGAQRGPRPLGFQPRQMARPGGNAPYRPNRPPSHSGFVPHQLRGNQRPPGPPGPHGPPGPPRFTNLPPPPPPPPMHGPMGPGMGPPHPDMDGPPPPHMMPGPGPFPPPPMPPMAAFSMVPPGPPLKPVTVSAKPTTYSSKPVLNKKKKKVKKEKSVDVAEKAAEEKEAVKPKEPPVATPSMSHHHHPPQQPIPMKPEALPPPPMPPQMFTPAPIHTMPPVDLSHMTHGGAYELGSASEPLRKKDKKKKFVRVAAGMTWEDDSLCEWDPNDFRIFAGDLGNEVTEDTLMKVFGSYPSFIKCKIVRDKRTNKTKGYGFVSFKDPKDFVQAIKDWNGKYVGNRPIKLLKSTWKDRDIGQVKKKHKEKERLGLR